MSTYLTRQCLVDTLPGPRLPGAGRGLGVVAVEEAGRHSVVLAVRAAAGPGAVPGVDM